MRLAFHWFYLKSRSLLLVYRDAISDSYTFFLSGCLAKTSAELATMCKHKPKTLFSGFAGVCGFCGRFADFCGIFAGRFGRVVFVFCRFCAKSALNRTSRRGCGVRPAYPTLMHYSGSLKNCYLHSLHARDREGLYDETLKIIQFPWFWCVSVFDDDPQKTRRLQQ